jgi:Peptidase family M13
MYELRLSFDAYKSFAEKNGLKSESLIGMNEFTSDQLFFVSFAQSLCSVERPQKMLTKVRYGDYSLNRYRVIDSLKNFHEFHHAFGCKNGQKMYREVDEPFLFSSSINKMYCSEIVQSCVERIMLFTYGFKKEIFSHLSRQHCIKKAIPISQFFHRFKSNKHMMQKGLHLVCMVITTAQRSILN